MTPASFFVPTNPGPTAAHAYADRVEIHAYDRDGNPMGSATVLGSVKIDPIDVSHVEQYTVTITGDGIEIRP